MEMLWEGVGVFLACCRKKPQGTMECQLSSRIPDTERGKWCIRCCLWRSLKCVSLSVLGIPSWSTSLSYSWCSYFCSWHRIGCLSIIFGLYTTICLQSLLCILWPLFKTSLLLISFWILPTSQLVSKCVSVLSIVACFAHCFHIHLCVAIFFKNHY